MFSSRQCGARLASIGSEWRMNEKSSQAVWRLAGKKPPGDGEKSLFFKLFWLHLKAAGWWATEDLYTFLYTRVRR